MLNVSISTAPSGSRLRSKYSASARSLTISRRYHCSAGGYRSSSNNDRRPNCSCWLPIRSFPIAATVTGIPMASETHSSAAPARLAALSARHRFVPRGAVGSHNASATQMTSGIASR
ncbi:hypothetical protein MELE44368_16875 [Mycolicibacterium elephantis DSM 44368]|uniref:Uncharacterized protein n=1 Tax=Mycolicibacterium elephantis DSM 44368 TaxID=1335622 RepID=A0A439DWC0_9MYCO|nr:hypothetical protein MELE44368_16875 [Mycolicibacterium elephantis DSM 44368]